MKAKIVLQGNNLTDEDGPQNIEPRRSFPKAQNSFLPLESEPYAAGQQPD